MNNDKLKEFRKKFIENRKVVCTGNPNKPYTIANGIKKIWPNTTFLSLSTGWDLLTSTDDSLKEVFSKHNTFINASYVGPKIQSRLLELCNQSVKFCDVINIGSTHEYDGNGSEEYQNSKLDLREKSLRLNTFRFQTYHMILGLLQNSTNLSYSLDIDDVCQYIMWILSQEVNIPLITIDSNKQPW
jgi:hypothetical protein